MIDPGKTTLEILEKGPKRVMITPGGSAMPPDLARIWHGIVPVIVFVRSDGWSLGVPKHLEKKAEAIWKNEWAFVLRDFQQRLAEFKSTAIGSHPSQ